MKSQRLRKIISVISSFNLLFQTFLPLTFALPAYAEDVASDSGIVVVTPTPEITPSEEPTPTISISPEPTAEPTIEITPSIAPTPEVTPSLEPTVTPEETPTPEPTQEPTPNEEQNNSPPSEDNSSPTPELTPTPTPSISLPADLTTISELKQDITSETAPSITTDKTDYFPTDTVHITGNDFLPNTTYTLKISSSDNPIFNFTPEVISDENGNILLSFTLDGNYRPHYTISAFDSEGILISTYSFLDSRMVVDAKVNGGSTASVFTGETVNTQVSVLTWHGLFDWNNDWRSTSYKIGDNAMVCINTTNHNNSGTHTESFDMTAPSIAGIYNIVFQAYSDDSCNNDWISFSKTLNNALTVTQPNVCGDSEKTGNEECDGTDGVLAGQNFCTKSCKLIPIYIAPSFTAQLSSYLFSSSSPDPFLTGTITDATSNIGYTHYAIWNRNSDGTKGAVAQNWTNLLADDGTYDEKTEELSVQLGLISLPEGKYIIGIRGYDTADNKVSAGDFVFEVDNTAPTINITQPTNSQYVGKVLTIKGTTTDDNFNYYYCYVTKDGSEVGVRDSSCVTTWHSVTNGTLGSVNLTGLSDRNYEITFVARDKAGTYNSVTVPFILDNTVPVISNAKISGDPVTIQPGNCSAPDFNLVSSTINLNADITDGDGSGVASATFRVVKINTSGCTMTNPAHDYGSGVMGYQSTTQIMTGPDGNTWTAAFDTKSLPGDGIYAIMLTSIDNLGNTNTKYIDIKVDNTNPTSTITTPINTATNQTVITNNWDGLITGTSFDVASGVNHVELSINRASDNKFWDGSTWITGTESTVRFNVSGTDTWSYTLPSPLEDTYIITSHAVDNAGNIESSYTITIVYDKTIPEVSISLNPISPDASNGWYKTQPEVTLALTSTDANLDKIEYQWDGKAGTWITYSTPFKLSSEGPHVLYYRAHDLADNYSSIGNKNIRWDKTDLEYGPQNVSADPNPTSGTTSKIKWEMAKDNVGIDKYEIHWYLNGGTSSEDYTITVGSDIREKEIDKLIEGRWTVSVRAFDTAGNSKDAAIDLNVDRTGPTAPTLTLLSTGTGTATLAWNSIEDARDYIVWYGNEPGQRLYGARVGNTTSYTVRGLGAGNYYFTVKAVDAAQNQGAESNEVNTGRIVGTPGVAPETPAEGFEPEVLGTNTEANPTITPTISPTSEPTSTSTVLGDSTDNNGFNWWWLSLLLLLIPIYLIARKKKKHVVEE